MKFILLSSLCLFAIAVAGHRYGIEYYSERDSKGMLNQRAFEGDGCQNLNFGKSYEMKKLDDNHCCAFFHDYGCAPDQFVFASESKKQDTPNGIKSIQCKEKSCDDLEDGIKSKDRSTTSSSTSSKTSSEESSTTERRRSTSSDESSTTSRRRSTPSYESSTTEESTSTMSTTFSTLTRKSTTTTDSDTTTKETSTSTLKQAKETESTKFNGHIKICPRKGQEDFLVQIKSYQTVDPLTRKWKTVQIL
ncbi:hypothetical protein FPQ18DRAFT_310970 [Pyronema domesticum]|nr:hypothetical protein FPQ18DRAFT_310970 [Pyronema domesticum]